MQACILEKPDRSLSIRIADPISNLLLEKGNSGGRSDTGIQNLRLPAVLKSLD